MKRFTIREVAARAGVSISTVSRALNKVESVDPDIAARVQKIANELGFSPNYGARILRGAKTHTLGIVVGDISNPFFMNIAREIETFFFPKGYSLFLVSTDDEAERERMALESLSERAVDGIIVSPSGQNDHVLQRIRNGGTPVVLMDRRSLRFEFDIVYVDKAAIAQELCETLFAAGHRRIALISGPKHSPTNIDRLAGYTRALAERSVPVQKELVCFGTYTPDYGVEMLRKLIAMSEPPTAIISGSCQITKGVLLEAHAKNVAIPESVSLVSQGDIELSPLMPRQLTFVRDQAEQIGRNAAELMWERISHPDSPVRQVKLSTELVPGDTVAPPPARATRVTVSGA